MKKTIENDYNPVVGVDIAPDYIRLVELDRIGRDYHLLNIAIEPTPAGCMEDGVIVKPKVIGKAIKGIMRDYGFSCKSGVAAVRGSRVISRMLTLPAMPHDRLRRLIETEINRYVVFGKQDKVVFYHPLEEFDEDHRRKVSVMLVAADKALCNSYYQTLREAGLKCEALDVSTFAILRVLRNRMPSGLKSGSMMSVVYDYHGISLNVFHGDTLRFYRTLRMDGLDPAQLKNGFMDKFMSEMLLALQYYQSEYHRGEPIRKIILSLGAAGGMSILDKLQDNVAGVPVEVHAPFSNIKIDVKQFNQSLLEKIDFNFITSVGLALRGQESESLPFRVDLLPQDTADSAEFSSALVKMLIPMLIVLTLIFGATAYTSMQLKKIVAQNNRLESEIQDLDMKAKALTDIDSQWHGIPIETPAGKQFEPAVNLLGALQRVTPENVQITAFEMDNTGSVELEAMSDDGFGPGPGDDLIGTMNESGFFTGATKSNDNTLPPDNGIPAVRAFTVKGTYTAR